MILNHLTHSDTSLFEGIAKAADHSLFANSSSRAEANKDGKKTKEDEETRHLFSLLDKTIKASSELIIDLLNFSLPSERFDTLNLFENKAPKAHSNVILSQPPVQVTNMYKEK